MWSWPTGKILACLFPVAATWLLTDSAFFLPAFSLVFLPSSILLSHWSEATSLLTNKRYAGLYTPL